MKVFKRIFTTQETLRWAGSPEMLSPVFHGMIELVLSLCGREQGSWQGVERLESHKYVTGIAQQLGADSLHRPQAGEKQQLN